MTRERAEAGVSTTITIVPEIVLEYNLLLHLLHGPGVAHESEVDLCIQAGG